MTDEELFIFTNEPATSQTHSDSTQSLFKPKRTKEELRKIGEAYEDFLTDSLPPFGIIPQFYKSRNAQYNVGEGKLGLEAKFDGNIEKYGNVYLEYGEKQEAATNYVDSGFLRKDNSWLFGIGDYSQFFIFSTRRLRDLFEDEEEEASINRICDFYFGDTSRAMRMPVSFALTWADKHFVFPKTTNGLKAA